ncbi:MAG: 1-deoxy-D-xylulose-5-phosphate synthase, partial [Lentisphaerae bacterium]|nr:1-deoxy-D-xylulose-5-phosphate synthase [Lentisphaerota bacterium]
KGRGFAPAEHAPEAWHGVPPFDAATGELPPPRRGYSEAFGTALVRLAEQQPGVVAITASMRTGTGLDGFAKRFPDRFFDVGISEGHAVTFAAGLAAGGLRPVVALYSTFMQRGVDNIFHDVCLQRLPVLFCLDRAGVVGADGATHHGIYDLPLLRCLPHLVIQQPRDEAMLARMLATALAHPAPAVIRYPRDPGPAATPSDPPEPLVVGTAEVLEQPDRPGPAVWFWALGDMLPLARAAAAKLNEAGIATGLVDPRFIKPIDSALLLRQAASARCFVTLENGVVTGGFGTAVREALAEAGIAVPTAVFGWPDTVIGQGTTATLRAEHGLTADAIAAAVQMCHRKSP